MFSTLNQSLSSFLPDFTFLELPYYFHYYLRKYSFAKYFLTFFMHFSLFSLLLRIFYYFISLKITNLKSFSYEEFFYFNLMDILNLKHLSLYFSLKNLLAIIQIVTFMSKQQEIIILDCLSYLSYFECFQPHRIDYLHYYLIKYFIKQLNQ